MTIESVTTRYGAPANEALTSAVGEAKAEDPLAPTTVVVPSHYAGLAAARMLGSRRGVAAVAFVTVGELAEQLGGRRMAAAGQRPASKVLAAGAVRSALRSEPGHFSGVETHPATVRALVDAHIELSEVAPRGLDELAAQSVRAADVVRVHRAAAEILRRRFCSAQQQVDYALTALESDPAAAEGLGRVLVFLPQHLAGSQIRLLRAVAAKAQTTVIAGRTGHPDADAAVMGSLLRLGADTASDRPHADRPPTRRPHADHPHADHPHADRTPTDRTPTACRPADRTPTTRSAGATAGPHDGLKQILQGIDVTAVSVSDADEEVRHAIRAVVSAVRAGAPLGRCAVVYGSPQPYARSVCDALDAAGIKRFGADVRTPATAGLGRALLSLLALHGDGFSRRGVMDWLDIAHAPIAYGRPPGGRSRHLRPVPAAAWERIARSARVEADLDDWDNRLRVYIDGRRSEAAQIAGSAASEEHLWLSERYTRAADQAESLLAFVRALHHRLHRTPTRGTWKGMAEWCRGLVRRYLGGRRRSSWPDDEQRLAEQVDTAIDRIGSLDGIDDVGEGGLSVPRFRRALELELSGRPYTRSLFGDGVLAGPLGMALGIELDLLVVCGMAEGVLPPRCRDSALLPDRERRNTASGLQLHASRTGDEHRAFLAALASARRVLLLYPRGDLRRSVENSPSRWLLDVAAARNQDGGRPRRLDPPSHPGGWLEEVPSFAAGLRRTSFPASEQEYDTRALLDWRELRFGPTRTASHENQLPGTVRSLVEAPASKAGDDDWRALLHEDAVVRRPMLERGIESVLARRSPRLTRFDGNLCTDGDLRGVALPSPLDADATTSASRLEAWARCPHSYFMRYALGVEAVQDDLHGYRISPLDLGNAIHRTLDLWLSEALRADEAPTAREPWPARWRRRLLEIGEEQCDRLEACGLSGRKVYWRSDRKRLLADLHRFLDFDDEMRIRRASTPVAAELGFGLPGSGRESGFVELDLAAAVEGGAPENESARSDTPTDTAGSAAQNTGSNLPQNTRSNRVLRFWGSIDRLDTTEAGGLTVVDYKTGSAHRYKKLRTEEPAPGGRHLQLVLYALAARQLADAPQRGESSGTAAKPKEQAALTERDRGEYWFVTSKGGFQSVGYPVALARERVLETVAGIVEGIDSGLFPKRPPRLDWRSGAACRFCAPDGLSTRAARREWQRKRSDPILSRYAELVADA